MKKSSPTKKSLSRRKFLPLLGGGLLLPFYGSARAAKKIISPSHQEYEILLTKEGKTVKVKKGTVAAAKIEKQQVSNTSLLKWLRKNNPNQ